MAPEPAAVKRGPIRLLFAAADLYPPFRVDVAALFGQEIASRGHQITWLLQAEAPCERAYRTTWNGGRVFVGANDPDESRLGRLRKHLRGLRNDLRLLEISKRERFDIVQIKDKFLSALLGLIAARRSGARFVFWLSYPYPESSIYEARTGVARYRWFYYVRGYVFWFLLYKVIAPRADHIIVQSEQMKRDVAAAGVDPEKVTAVPMGFIPEDFSRIETVTDLPDAPIVAYIGTLLQTRKLDFLVRVMARVLEQVPDAMLLMVGPEELPGDQRVLREEARRLGIEDRLILTGRVERPRALGYAAAADVCVSPFYPTPILNSTSPTKLVEYMALGKAVVANDHPEQKLVIEESGAGHCVPYDEAAFADAIVRLLRDPESARRMGCRGREYVHDHRAYPVIADGVQNLYWHILGASSAAEYGAGEPHPAGQPPAGQRNAE